jgi:hypothetical protein
LIDVHNCRISILGVDLRICWGIERSGSRMPNILGTWLVI